MAHFRLADDSGVSFRPLQELDLPPALELSTRVGWNQLEQDWRVFIEQGSVYGLFSPRDGLVATAAILPVSDRVSWISMVIVHPDYRRRGLATALTAHCRDEIHAAGRVAGLDASEQGRAVYEALGFHSGKTILRLRGQGGGSPEHAGTPPAAPAAVNSILLADRQWSGFSRGYLLKNLLSRESSRLLCQTDPEGRAGAFAMARAGRTATQVGPIGATGHRQALALLEEIIPGIPGPVILDVPARHKVVVEFLESMAFAEERRFVRMFSPVEPAGLDFGNVFAIAGPEFS